MKWIESIMAAFVPSVLISEPEWRSQWHRDQREQFLPIARISLPIISAGYIANYYLFDLPMGLEPIEFWFRFRLQMAGLCLAAFALYWTPIVRTRYFKLPAIAACLAICYSQALVSVWYGKEAWVFFFGFIIASSLLLRLNALGSIFFATAAIAVSMQALHEGGVPFANLLSGSIVTFGTIIALRASAVAEVRNFLLNQENIAAQKRISDLNVEYADRVRSFIPKVIADRLTTYIERDRMTVVEASIEALKARKTFVSCLFTDIRGYTQGSKNLDQFITESVLPEVKACSDTIEARYGIPRKVGDLIFAYFDSLSKQKNILRALIAAIEVSRINESMNATSAKVQIRRYILLASGDAMVGNFGGLDSSIEITALGTPVNYLSRIDDLTKAPRLAIKLKHGELIVCEESKHLLNQIVKDLPFNTIDLKELRLEVRDFPETSQIHTLTPSDQLYERLLDVYADLTDRLGGREEPRIAV